jgi:signal transduction histidine kinase
MTIKRQLFFSNIRMVLVTVGGLMAVFLVNRIVIAVIFGTHKYRRFLDLESFRRLSGSLLLFSIAAFLVFFIVINGILSRRMTNKITMPLETLNRGVKQIQENNLSYRIEYHEDDEFRPVCEAFNQMAAQLEASTKQRLKDEANRRELLAGISHDLRTPLTAISGYLDGLESGVASTPEKQKNYLNTIKNNTAGMKHIIEQLFLFSKLDMNEFQFSPSRFNISLALSDMIEEIAEEYAARGLDITISEGPENVFVFADVMQLRRVIINILENSVSYREKETGHMEISIAGWNSFVQLRFADDGPGVNPEAIPDLFNAFYRTDPSRHTSDHGSADHRSAGSGLGLAISAKIIERSGGTIHAVNGNSGGLSIVINLPIEKGLA